MSRSGTKSTLLYVNMCTKRAEHRLILATELQREIPEALDGWDKFFITDTSEGVSPPPGYDCMRANLMTHGRLSFSVYRNLAMTYAAEHNYDWIIVSNADVVMLQSPRSFPRNGLSSVMTYHSRPNEDIRDILALWRAGVSLHFQETTFLLMGRDIFGKYRFCEEFYGYGHEDGDFLSHVLAPEGISRLDGTPYGARGVHINHDNDGVWENIESDLRRNESLFAQRQQQVKRGERVY
jgi:hypothetical protein